MKVFLYLVVAGLVAAAYAETPLQKVRKHSDACKRESGVSDEVLARARKGEKVDDPKLRDHGVCILKKSGFLDDNGDFQVEIIRTKLKENADHPEKVDDLVAKCAVKKDTPQESTHSFFRCLHENHLS
ncbi:unnamed protein product [Tenebrio molitor]|nr:unnamed protein product [Tenebrio molitor]